MRFKVLACAAAALALAAPASAATITKVISFTNSGYSNLAPGSTATDPVQGSFTLTLDPSQIYTNEASGITLNSLNINLGSALLFSTFSNGILAIGGADAGVTAINTGHEDFLLAFQPDFLGGSGAHPTFAYSATDVDNNVLFGKNIQITVSDPSAAPEPSTWLFMLTGVAAVGAALRFGRRQALGLDRLAAS